MQLIVENLVQVRGGRTIIDHLSFSVAGGEALLLTGPNGAGKTTLMRTLAGFLRPEAGSIRLDGGDPERTIAEQCHFIGHLNGIKANLTVAENLTFWAEYLDGMTGADVPGRVANALEAFEIAQLGAHPGRLSLGRAEAARGAGPPHGDVAPAVAARRADVVAGHGLGGPGRDGHRRPHRPRRPRGGRDASAARAEARAGVAAGGGGMKHEMHSHNGRSW